MLWQGDLIANIKNLGFIEKLLEKLIAFLSQIEDPQDQTQKAFLLCTSAFVLFPHFCFNSIRFSLINLLLFSLVDEDSRTCFFHRIVFLPKSSSSTLFCVPSMVLWFEAMSAVNITNVTVLDNPDSFLTPFQFEIYYECLTPLKDGKNLIFSPFYSLFNIIVLLGLLLFSMLSN